MPEESGTKPRNTFAIILLLALFGVVVGSQIWSDLTLTSRFKEAEQLRLTKERKETAAWRTAHPREAAEQDRRGRELAIFLDAQTLCLKRTTKDEIVECLAQLERREKIACLAGPDWRDCPAH